MQLGLRPYNLPRNLPPWQTSKPPSGTLPPGSPLPPLHSHRHLPGSRCLPLLPQHPRDLAPSQPPGLGANLPHQPSLSQATTLTSHAMILELAGGMVTQLLLPSRTHAPGRPSTIERGSTPMLLTFYQVMRTPPSAELGRHPPLSPPMPMPQPAPLPGGKVRVGRMIRPVRPKSRRPAMPDHQ